MDARVVAAVLGACVLATALCFSGMAASGADSQGYVSQADLWLGGVLVRPQPWADQVPWPNAAWTFSPLGYRPFHDEKVVAIVPTYAPGLPLLMAGAKLIGGSCAPYWVVPFAGALLVWTTFGLGRRLADAETGIVAAWLVAISPAFLFMLMWPMTDVPVAAAWAVAFYFLFRGTTASAAAAGAAVALAVLIRPNLVPGAGILGLWYLGQVFRHDGADRPIWLLRTALYTGFAALGVALTGWIHFHLYGSVLSSGYGDIGSIFDAARVGENLRLYPRWLVESESPLAIAGLAALFVPLRRLWPAARDRSAFVVIALFVLSIWAQYATYLVFDAWWYLRFLLATWPFMMIGSAAVLVAIMRALPGAARIAVGLVVIGLGLRQWGFARDHSIFELWRQEQRYPAVARRVEELTEPGSLVLAMQHSGSLRFYANRVTLRYDVLDVAWLERAIAWLGERGVRAYLLVEEWEIPEFQRRFTTERTAELIQKPLFTYVGASKVFLFDLQRPPDATPPDRLFLEDPGQPRCEAHAARSPELRFH